MTTIKTFVVEVITLLIQMTSLLPFFDFTIPTEDTTESVDTIFDFCEGWKVVRDFMDVFDFSFY
jgi:hypothetical protein